jgi:hypothetical protein
MPQEKQAAAKNNGRKWNRNGSEIGENGASCVVG